MHGTIMLLMFATPLFAGFANWIMPLQIGAPDVAFPRLNMFAYWLYLFGSLIAVAGFLTPQGAADFGWFAYSPLSGVVRSPGVGADMWIMGLAFSGFGTILGSVNFITTIICMRAPGMTMFRMPIFTWNVLLTGASRGVHHRVAVLRHHFRGHSGLLPEADVRLHRSDRRDDFHRRSFGDGLGAPHVCDGRRAIAVLLLHDIPHRGPDRCEVLQLDRHDVEGLALLRHYVIFGTVVFAMFSGFHFWWPKFTGKMLDERLGKITFWTLFVGFHGTFLVQHWLGVEGMPRRYADYLAADGFTTLNTISTIASFLLGLSILPFFYNVWKTAKYGKKVEVDDPWGYGRSLEWATSCPPPRHNFLTLPRIRSESPAFDLHHPEIAALDALQNGHGSADDKALAGGKEAGK